MTEKKWTWIRGTKYLLDLMFYSGIVVTVTLPFTVRWIGEQLPYLIRHYEETVIIYFVLGVSAEKLLWELRKIFRTVLAENCFVKENVVSLQKMGNWSFFIALMAGVRSIVYMTIAMGVVIFVFLIAGLFSPFAVDGVVNSFREGLLDFVGKFLGSQYVWITTLSVIAATFFSGTVEKLHGSQEIGTYLIYLFLFVIGVPANIYTVLTEAPLFLVLTFLMVVVNMLFCFAGARLLKFDLEDAIIASNANIGGPTTAAGMAVSQGWSRLVGPAMLVGVLGYVIGNYAGTVVGIILGA